MSESRALLSDERGGGSEGERDGGGERGRSSLFRSVDDSSYSVGRKIRTSIFTIAVTTLAQAMAIGLIYSFSIFNKSVAKANPRWNANTPVLAQAGMILMFGVVSAIAGPWIDAVVPGLLGFVGGLFQVSGLVVIAGAVHYDVQWVYYAGMTGLVGTGIALCNLVTMQYILRWTKSKKRGFGGGFFGLSVGAGSIAITLSAIKLVSSLGLFHMYLAMAGATAVLLLPFYAAMVYPPSAGSKGDLVVTSALSRVAIAQLPEFWAFFAVFVAVHVPGLGFLTLLPEAFESSTVSPSEAQSLTIVALAVYTLSRLAWGFASDYLGNRNSFFVFTLAQAAVLLALPELGNVDAIKKEIICGSVILCVSLCGGSTATFGSYVFEVFGPENAPSLIGLLLTGFGVAGVVGPAMASLIFHHTGNFDIYHYVCGALCFSAFFAIFAIRTPPSISDPPPPRTAAIYGSVNA